MKSAGKDFESCEMEEIYRRSPDLHETRDKIADSFLGLVRLEKDDACFLGSGTLVSIGTIRGILTAEHVLDALPKKGSIGLAMPTRFGAALGNPQVRLDRVTQVRMGRGKNESDGPDLGFVVLPDSVASDIPSTKTFYNLLKRRQQMLENPVPIHASGTWLLAGSAAEWARDSPGEAGFERIKDFQGAIGLGLAENERTVGDFDYLDFPAEYDENYEGPESFGGYSGGSLWHVLANWKHDKIIVTDCILSGVAFWQSGMIDSQRIIKCHGRKSIYQNLIDKVLNAYLLR